MCPPYYHIIDSISYNFSPKHQLYAALWPLAEREKSLLGLVFMCISFVHDFGPSHNLYFVSQNRPLHSLEMKISLIHRYWWIVRCRIYHITILPHGRERSERLGLGFSMLFCLRLFQPSLVTSHYIARLIPNKVLEFDVTAGLRGR